MVKISSNPKPATTTILLGTKKLLLKNANNLLQNAVPENVLHTLIQTAKPNDHGQAKHTLVQDQEQQVIKFDALVLPDKVSRHAAPHRPHHIAALVADAVANKLKDEVTILAFLEDTAHAPGTAMAIARALPLYCAKSTVPVDGEVQVVLIDPDGGVLTETRLLEAFETVQGVFGRVFGGISRITPLGKKGEKT